MGNFIVAGIRADRELVRTGEFSASGTAKRVLPEGESWTGAVRISCAFDNPSDRIRFDRHEDFVESNNKRLPFSEGGQFIRTPDRHTRLKAGDGDVVITAPKKFQPEWVKAIDIRTLGLAYYGDLERSTPFDAVMTSYASPAHSASREADGSYRIVWILPDMLLRRTIWVDPERGFWPTRLLLESGVKSNGEIAWTKETETHSLTLVNYLDVWLPRQLSIQAADRSLDLELDWTSLNTPIDDKVFTVDGFNLEGAKRVMNLSLGSPIIERRLDLPDGLQSSSSPWYVRNAPIMAVVIGCIVIFGALVLKAFRRRPIP